MCDSRWMSELGSARVEDNFDYGLLFRRLAVFP